MCRGNKGGFFMAGSYTEHYQLSQRQPQDRVLRTEFNQDNARLDGALHALAESQGRAAPKLLQEVLQLPQGSTYSLNLTGIDWSGWREVWVDMDLSTDKSCVVYIDINGRSSDRLGATEPAVSAGEQNGLCRLILCPYSDARRMVCGFLMGSSPQIVSSNTAFSAFKTLYFTASDGTNLLTGCTLRVWGIQ